MRLLTLITDLCAYLGNELDPLPYFFFCALVVETTQPYELCIYVSSMHLRQCYACLYLEASSLIVYVD
jgi:hypothetical protein